MRIAIVEDEVPARKHLLSSLEKLDLDFQLIFESASIKNALESFEVHKDLDLIFLDIQLNDGLSFEIFDYIRPNAPIVFTTAYDEYMLEAFQQNGIDYLLKPIKLKDLEMALAKYDRLKSHFISGGSLPDKLSKVSKNPRRRILAKKGISYKSISIEDVACFLSENKVTFLVDNQGESFVVDMPLSQLEEDLDDSFFLRANRKYLISLSSVDTFSSIGNGKLLVNLKAGDQKGIEISQEKASTFKTWVQGG